MISTPLENISQNGNLPQIGANIKNIWVATTQPTLLYTILIEFAIRPDASPLFQAAIHQSFQQLNLEPCGPSLPKIHQKTLGSFPNPKNWPCPKFEAKKLPVYFGSKKHTSIITYHLYNPITPNLWTPLAELPNQSRPDSNSSTQPLSEGKRSNNFHLVFVKLAKVSRTPKKIIWRGSLPWKIEREWFG